MYTHRNSRASWHLFYTIIQASEPLAKLNLKDRSRTPIRERAGGIFLAAAVGGGKPGWRSHRPPPTKSHVFSVSNKMSGG